MVPLNRQAPQLGPSRVAKHREEVPLRVADVGSLARFEFKQQLLHRHDRGRLLVPHLRDHAPQQQERGFALSRGHQLDLHPLARGLRNEVPVDPLGSGVGHLPDLELVGGELLEEGLRGLGGFIPALAPEVRIRHGGTEGKQNGEQGNSEAGRGHQKLRQGVKFNSAPAS